MPRLIVVWRKATGLSGKGLTKKGRIVGAIVFVSALWFGVAGVAAAENLGMAHADIAKRLESGYAETPVATGLSANGGSVVVLGSPDGETWTLVITAPKGISCAVIAGEAWDGRDTALAGARGVSDPVLYQGVLIMAHRDRAGDPSGQRAGRRVAAPLAPSRKPWEAVSMGHYQRSLVLRRGIRVERAGSEGTAPEPGRIQPRQFLVFTL